MALLIGGVVLVAGNGANVNATTLTYTPVFSDNFDRANATGTAIGNGWSFPGGYQCDDVIPNPAVGVDNWAITGNMLKGGAGSCNDTANGGAQYAWKSSPMLQPAYSIFNGKATFNYDATVSPNYAISGILGRFDATNGSGAFFGFYESPDNTINQLYMKLLPSSTWGNTNANGVTSISVSHNDFATGKPLPNHLQIELILFGNNWTFNAYDSDTSLTTPLYTAYGTDSRLSALTGRTWGLQAYSGNSPFDNFNLYKTEVPFTVTGDENVAFGKSITYTITDDTDQTVTKFSDGAGGTFSPTTVTLNSANNYTATVTYTPAAPGHHTVTADVSGGDTFSKNAFVIPYSTTIGLLGDSITNNVGTTYVANALGSGFSIVNVAVCGGRAQDLADDYNTTVKCGGLAGAQNVGDPWRTLAINALLANHVDVVHLMIGTNDLARTPAQYQADMQTTIDALKAAGIRQVIISDLIWRNTTQANLDQIAAFNNVIAQLVANNGGYVLAGDTGDAYTWFKNDNMTNMTDGLHPDAGLGRQTLANFWAGATLDNFAYQINPNHTWLSNVNSHQLATTGTLTFNIDKYLGEFSGVVKVDGVALPTSDYTVTAGSTDVELTAGYLNGLSVGTHNLVVGFNGGVTVADTFNITAADAGVCDNGATNYPDCDNNNGGGTTDPTAPGAPDTGWFGSAQTGSILVIGFVLAGGVGLMLMWRRWARR